MQTQALSEHKIQEDLNAVEMKPALQKAAHRIMAVHSAYSSFTILQTTARQIVQSVQAVGSKGISLYGTMRRRKKVQGSNTDTGAYMSVGEKSNILREECCPYGKASGR
jgi:hypothetical protein